MAWNRTCLRCARAIGGCDWMPAQLARTGLVVFAMLLAMTVLTERTAAGGALVAGVGTVDLPALREIAPARFTIEMPSAVVAGTASPPASEDPSTDVTTVPSAGPAIAITITAPAPPPPATAARPPAAAGPAVVALPVGLDAIVLASWYGPGFYGNRTACGQTYSPEILGVAHLTLPCGTALTLAHGSRSIAVRVIDRGPYVAGRTLDLSNATKLALGCTDLCTVRMLIGH